MLTTGIGIVTNVKKSSFEFSFITAPNPIYFEVYKLIMSDIEYKDMCLLIFQVLFPLLIFHTTLFHYLIYLNLSSK